MVLVLAIIHITPPTLITASEILKLAATKTSSGSIFSMPSRVCSVACIVTLGKAHLNRQPSHPTCFVSQ